MQSSPISTNQGSGPQGAGADLSPAPHPRTLGWIGTTALAIGGSNQSLFLIAALFIKRSTRFK